MLTLLCALLFLPGLRAIPPTDRDEARFMQATKQMIESGDYINIRFQAEPRNKKPVGIHWLQAAAVKLSGQSPSVYWPYRIPSVLAAWLAVLACYELGRRLYERRTGFIAATVLATSFMVVIEAHIAKTDAALLATTTIAIGALALMYTRPQAGSWTLVAVFWTALAVGTLVKGPVSLAVVLATVATLGLADRNIGWMRLTRPLVGIPIALAIVLPWLFASSGTASQNNFILEAVREDLIPKLIGGQESHGAPPGSHLLAGILTTWPWSLLLPFALVLAWRRRQEPTIRFCLAWLIGTWALFEIVPTKLPHYTLPAFPAVALLIAATLSAGEARGLAATAWVRGYRILWALFTAALGAAVISASLAYGDENGLFFAAAAAAVLAAAAGIAFSGFRGLRPFFAASAAAVAFFALLSAGVIPKLSELAISSRLAAAISAHQTGRDRAVAISGYSEPSAVFFLGTDTLLTDAAGVRDYLIANPGALGVMEAAAFPAATGAAAQAGGTLRKLSDIEGYNYSRGDRVALSIVTFDATGGQR